MTRYTLAPDLIAGLQALGQRWERLAAETPEARAATCRDKQRQAIIDAAYLGTGEQQAAMRVARQTGDEAAIARHAEAGLQRVGAALWAYDAVFGGQGAADDQRPSGGLPISGETI